VTEQELIDKAYEIMERERQRPAAERFQRLIDIGLIDEQGRVRDDVRFWHAYLAVVAVKPGGNGKQIEHFRCLKPAFGLPGSATIDVRRESLANYVREGKRIITATQHEKLGWKEAEDIRLTSQGFLRTDGKEAEQDDLGDLPQFGTVRSGL